MSTRAVRSPRQRAARRDELLDRLDQAIGDGERDPGGDADDQQRHAEQDGVELELERAGARLERVELGNDPVGTRILAVHEAHVHAVGDVEEDVPRPIERRHHPLLLGVEIRVALLVAQQVQHLAGNPRGEDLRRGRFPGVHRLDLLAVDDAEHHCLVEGAVIELFQQLALEGRGVGRNLREELGQVVDHGPRLGRPALGHEAPALLGEVGRRIERAPRALRAPELHAGLEHHRGRDHGEHDRDACHQGEHRDEPHMQPPAAGQRRLGGAVDGDPPADQHDQRDIGSRFASSSDAATPGLNTWCAKLRTNRKVATGVAMASATTTISSNRIGASRRVCGVAWIRGSAVRASIPAKLERDCGKKNT